MKKENEKEPVWYVYKDEAWKTSLKGIHPTWLLAFRIIVFLTMLGLFIGNAVDDGSEICFYYTQWTFILVIIYFGLGSAFSIYGLCYTTEKETHAEDVEVANQTKSPNAGIDSHEREIGGAWNYAFQIIFQVCGGAVLLTDILFWSIIFPVDHDTIDPDVFMVSLHSVNAIFLVADSFLNCMRFPMFRIAYFILWTAIYVIFQWIIHASVSKWWPYSFLEMDTPYAPLWYIGVGLVTIPCYGLFALIIKFKMLCLSKAFPGSLQID